MTNHEIERRGRACAEGWLRERGHVVEDSDRKSFDLRVDGRYYELKAKKHAWSRFDFIGLTENQYRGLLDGVLHGVVVVTGVEDAGTADVRVFTREDLLDQEPTVERHYYWYKRQLDGGVS